MAKRRRCRSDKSSSLELVALNLPLSASSGVPLVQCRPDCDSSFEDEVTFLRRQLCD